MNPAIAALARETGREAEELTVALFFLTSAGLGAQRAMDALVAAVKATA